LTVQHRLAREDSVVPSEKDNEHFDGKTTE